MAGCAAFSRGYAHVLLRRPDRRGAGARINLKRSLLIASENLRE